MKLNIFVCLRIGFFTLFVSLMEFPMASETVGGMAEMKALTRNEFYPGQGNLEQAPEYFGEAAARQAYLNPAYDYYGSGHRNFMNSYGGYMNSYRAYGGDLAPPMTLTAPFVPSSLSSLISPSEQFMPLGEQAAIGGIYKGSGNPWVKQH